MSPTLENAREKTDSSLETERLKSDASVAADGQASARIEDLRLNLKREQNDSSQRAGRDSSDLAREELREQRLHDSDGRRSEDNLEDQLIEDERKNADQALQVERSSADEARLRERRRLRLTAEALLALERSSTDRDLLVERTQTNDELAANTGQVAQSKAAENLAIACHDLRNPLHAIMLGGEVLQERLKAEPIDRAASLGLLSIIQRNAAIMERLVGDLLDVERMAGHSLQIQVARLCVDDLFSECGDLFDSIAAKKGLKLEIPATSGGLVALADHDRILQVLSNLLGNAIKHTRSGGTISLAAQLRDQHVHLTVSDSGTGIPAHEQQRIFEKFSQAGITGRQGLGLGLYISKGIIEAHGGTITVSSSKPGQGSSFCFSLPAILA